jgi:hypothetical protein
MHLSLQVPVCSFNKTTGLYTYEAPAYNGWANGLNSNGQSCTVMPTPVLPAGAPTVARPCSVVAELTATTGICECAQMNMVGLNCNCDTTTSTWIWIGDAASSCQLSE